MRQSELHEKAGASLVDVGGASAPGLLFAGGTALAVAMGIGRFAYTPILPAMETARLDTYQAGLLASANYAGYLAGALAAAAIASPAVRGRILMVCLLAVVATTALMAATTNLIAWGAIRFLAGLASAGVFVLASGIVLDVLGRSRRASLSGWLYSGVGAGIALSGVVVRAMGGALGWRGDWIVLAVLAALVIYPSGRRLLLAHGPGPMAHVRAGAGREARTALVLLLLAYFLEGTGYIVTGTFLVAIVDRMRGLAEAGPSVWIVVGLAGVPSGVAWSWLAVRIGYAWALSLAYVVQACGIALPLLGGAGSAFVSALCFGGTFLGISTLTLTLAGHIALRQSAGIVGLLTAGFGLGQILGPILAGRLVGHSNDFGTALAAAAVIVLLGAILVAAVYPFDPSRMG